MIKTLVVYFSQTGYTKKAAELIRDGIFEVNGHCDLVTLAQADREGLRDYELVGIGCPVFYYQEPFNVRDWLESLPHLGGKYWFVFCTHGSAIGVTFHSITERLRKKGVKIIGYFDMYADATMPHIPHPTLTTGHPDEIDLAQALAFGREIAHRIQRVLEGDLRAIPPGPEPVAEEFFQRAQMFTPELLRQIMPTITLNRELCIQCGLCEENCPVGGIDLSVDPPRLNNPCIYCFYCVEVCPKLALEADWDFFASTNVDHYAFLRKHLDQAVAEGKFRWLIDPDSLDFENYLYKQWMKKRRS